RAASGFALVVSGSVLLGWHLDLPILRSILPGRAAMSPLTAVTFLLIASALWVETESSGGHRPIRWLARAAASLVLLVGLVTVFGYDLGENLSLDQSRFLERLGTDGIEPNTGLCFVLLSVALLLLDSESHPRVWPAQFILLISAVIFLTSLLRDADGAPTRDGLPRYIPVALPTAATFFVLSVGTLWARPGRGLVAVATADDQGGVLARRLLPAAILIPAFLGWLRLVAEHRGLLSAQLGVAIMVVVSAVLLTALIVATCQSVHRVELMRKAAERRIATLVASCALPDRRD